MIRVPRERKDFPIKKAATEIQKRAMIECKIEFKEDISRLASTLLLNKVLRHSYFSRPARITNIPNLTYTSQIK